LTSSARLGWGLNIQMIGNKGIGFRENGQEPFSAGGGTGEHIL
jgi:hypothetical protein